MKRPLLAFLSFLSVFGVKADSIPWTTNAPVFRADASLTNAPTLLYFTAEWCGYCKLMDRTTLADEAVVGAVSLWSAVKLDLDENPEMAGRFDVRGVPAFLFVNARGEEVSRTVGASEAGDFMRWLAEAPDLAASRARDTARKEAQLADLKRRLGSTEGPLSKGLFDELLRSAARGDGAGQRFAIGELADRAATNVDRLVEALDHEDLACRILALTLLQRSLNAPIPVDVWAPGEERRSSIDQWRRSRNAIR